MINALDFLNELCDRLAKPQFETLEVSQFKAHHRKLLTLLNRVLQTVGAYNDWPLLRTEGSIVVLDSLTTDGDSSEYVTATQNSTALTVAGQSFDETYIGRAIQVNGDDYIYRIAAVTSPTGLTLDRAWVNANLVVADEKVATIAMDRYALPSDFGRPVDDWQSFFAPYNIEPRSANEFREVRRRERDIRLGEAEVYTKFGMTDNEAAEMVHFHPWPETARILRFEYQKNHPVIDSDQDKILYPLTYLEALLDVCLHLANRDYENSTKAQQALLDSIRSHNMQQSNPGATDPTIRIEPMGETRIQIKEAYGDTVTDIDWGDWFTTGRKHGL
jgi:hypothetical protein